MNEREIPQQCPPSNVGACRRSITDLMDEDLLNEINGRKEGAIDPPACGASSVRVP
jgi:hypothetical protein